MNKKFVALLLLLAMLLLAPSCLAQMDHDQGSNNIWLTPSWVFGSGYTPYDYYPSGLWGYGYDPFSYYSYQGKTYNPYRYYYSYQYPYRYSYWYPFNYYSNDLWSW